MGGFAISFLGEILDRAFFVSSFFFLRKIFVALAILAIAITTPPKISLREIFAPSTLPLRGRHSTATRSRNFCKKRNFGKNGSGENGLSNFCYLREFRSLVSTGCQIFISREILTHSTKFWQLTQFTLPLEIFFSRQIFAFPFAAVDTSSLDEILATSGIFSLLAILASFYLLSNFRSLRIFVTRQILAAHYLLPCRTQ